MGLILTLFAVSFTLSFIMLLPVLRTQSTSKVITQRLANIRKSARVATGALDTDLEKEDPWGYMESLEQLLERYGPGKKLKELLLHANSNMSLSGFFIASFIAGLGTALLTVLFTRTMWIGLVGLLPGAIVPGIVLRFKRNKRLKSFNNALPDAIDLMARCLVAGHSVGSSIEMIGQQAPEPLAFEFVQVYQQQRLGLQFREALLQMAGRVPSRDLQFFITAILVQKETGGDLTEILDRTSHVIRERVRIEGEVRTRTAQGRLTGWILGLLPVVMLVLINIVSPGYSDVLFHDPVGKDLMYAGAGLIAIGAFFIKRIVNIQV